MVVSNRWNIQRSTSFREHVCIYLVLLLVFFPDSSDRHWIGMWWGGFLICGALLILISVPFFFFPKELKVWSSLFRD